MLNRKYICFKNNAHALTGKERKFSNFIKKALDELNEPYLKSALHAPERALGAGDFDLPEQGAEAQDEEKDSWEEVGPDRSSARWSRFTAPVKRKAKASR